MYIKKLCGILLLCILMCVGCSRNEELVEPDKEQQFRIFQSFVMDRDGYTDTTLKVILCEKDIQISEKLYEEIIQFHDNMNGSSDKMTIYLFESKKDFLEDRVLDKVVFY